MGLYFKDRTPNPIHGKNRRFYDAIDANGKVILPDFEMVMKNDIPSEKQGDPVNAANLNYASGCDDFATSPHQSVRRGDVLTLIAKGTVSPAKTAPRPVAAVSDRFPSNWIAKLSDTQYIYSGATVAQNTPGLQVITVNWANKTAELSAPAALSNAAYTSMQFEVVAPGLFCVPTSSTTSEFSNRGVAFMTANGTNLAWSTTWQGVNIGYMRSTRPVRCGSDGVLTVSLSTAAGTSGTCSLKLIKAGATAAAASVTVSGITDESQLLSLVTYDGGVNKYVLFYAASAGGSVIYARPVTVSGTNIIVSSDIQDVSGNLCWQCVNSSCASISNTWRGKALFTSYATYKTNVGPALEAQAATFSDTGFVTFGRRVVLPVMALCPPGYITSGYQAAPAWATFRDDGTAFITATQAVPPYRDLLVELRLENADLFFDAYSPYFNPTDNSANLKAKRCNAIENPTKRGEFLFVENVGASNTGMNFYFGYETDAPLPTNVVGIALDNSSGPFVKTQISQKLLRGIAENLTPLNWYMLGVDGSLAVYDGSSPSLGMAVSPNDFIFNGPVML